MWTRAKFSHARHRVPTQAPLLANHGRRTADRPPPGERLVGHAGSHRTHGFERTSSKAMPRQADTSEPPITPILTSVS